MRFKLASLVLSMALVLFIPKAVFAQAEFSTSYDINYDTFESGETLVSEKITLKNLTEKYYAKEYTLSLSSLAIYDVSAFDESGPLEVLFNNSQSPLKKQITVRFKQQLTGKDKQYAWTLKFKTKDFSDFQDNLKQITIPRVVKTEDIEDIRSTLFVPVSFSDPTLITPKPKVISESGGKLEFKFNKDQVLNYGIFVLFGQSQNFNFELKVDLINKGLFPKYFQVPIPSDSPNQLLNFSDISPLPENVYQDLDGNYIALFKVDKFKSTTVKVLGQVKLAKFDLKEDMPDSELVNSKKYWEKGSPSLDRVLSKIFAKNIPSAIDQKTQLINQYVVDTLSFDYNRLIKGQYERFGSLSILNNPQRALCSDFVDLFIALSRSAGVPSREIVGYANSKSFELKPLSYKKDLLHCWAEFFDGTRWKTVDPTWQNTTGGVNYFNNFDLNHFKLASRGHSSTYPDLIPDIKISKSTEFLDLKPQLTLNVDLPNEIFSGITYQGVVRIENKGQRVYPGGEMVIESLHNKRTIPLPDIPAFGNFEYKFNLKEGDLTQSFINKITVKIDDLKVEKEVQVISFFALKQTPLVVALLIFFLVLIYSFSLYAFKRSKKGKKQ